MEINITKAAAEGVTKAVIDSVLKPVIHSGLQGLRNVTAGIFDVFLNRFGKYVQLQYEKHSCLNTIVFGNTKLLEDLYIPLTVQLNEEFEVEREVPRYRISGFESGFLPKYKRVLITDTAGMGKSTLSKFLYLKSVESQCAVPIFVELRQLSEKNSILSLVANQLNMDADDGSDLSISIKRIERIFHKGGFVFFLDGYDEVPYKEREAVTKDIRAFVDKHPLNYYLMTSRPESALAAFPNFQKFSIVPLEKEESYTLIRKYDRQGERSKQLVEKLEDGMYSSVEGFLKNPLLTTLLYRCFEYRQQIPLKKHIFYRHVFDALFDWHDSTKDGYNTREKKCGLDQDAFHKVLRIVGFISVMSGEVEGSVDTVLEWVRKAKLLCDGLSFSESNFLDDIIRAVPVFVKDGLYFRWSHKSLAEYFAAQYLFVEGKSKQHEILTRIFGSDEMERFVNVLDQLYDIDNSGFVKSLVLPTAKEFAKVRNEAVLKFKGIIPESDVEDRVATMFGSLFVFVRGADSIENLFDIGLGKLKKPLLNNSEFMILHVGHFASVGYDFFVAVLNNYGIVLKILVEKNDGLVVFNDCYGRHGDVYKYIAGIDFSSVPNPSHSKMRYVTIDVGDNLNSRENFSAVTKFLSVSNSHCVDVEKMLAFEFGYSGEKKLSSFADELLDGISSPKGRRRTKGK